MVADLESRGLSVKHCYKFCNYLSVHLQEAFLFMPLGIFRTSYIFYVVLSGGWAIRFGTVYTFCTYTHFLAFWSTTLKIFPVESACSYIFKTWIPNFDWNCYWHIRDKLMFFQAYASLTVCYIDLSQTSWVGMGF